PTASAMGDAYRNRRATLPVVRVALPADLASALALAAIRAAVGVRGAGGAGREAPGERRRGGAARRRRGGGGARLGGRRRGARRGRRGGAARHGRGRGGGRLSGRRRGARRGRRGGAGQRRRGGRRGRRRRGCRRGRGRGGARGRRGRGQGRRGGRRRGGRDDGMEGGKHHVPGIGRAEGQATLLRAGGAGQDVLEVGGGAPVPHVEDVGHHLAATGSREHRLAAGEDGRHDQLAGGDQSGRARAGVGSLAVRFHGLIERSHRGHMSVVGDRLLHI